MSVRFDNGLCGIWWREATWLSFLLVLAGLFTITPGLHAQCAHGTVTVQGKVENLAPGKNAQVLTVVQTPKDTYSQVARITNGQFEVAVQFSYLKSWSPLWGHRCSNTPNLVEVKLEDRGKVLVGRKLKISTEFKSKDGLSYTLKRELILDTSGGQ